MTLILQTISFSILCSYSIGNLKGIHLKLLKLFLKSDCSGRNLHKKYASKTAVNAIGYKELKPFLDGEKTLEECIDHLKQSTRRYAKRQLTWFNRNEKINWVYPDTYNDINLLYNEAERLAEKFLKGE